MVVRQPNRTGVCSRAEPFTVILSDNVLPGGIATVRVPLSHIFDTVAEMLPGANEHERALSTPLTMSVNVAGSLPDACTSTARSRATSVALGDR